MVAIAKLNYGFGMSQKSIKNPHNSDISFAPKLIGYQFKEVESKVICSKQDSVSSLHKNVYKKCQ